MSVHNIDIAEVSRSLSRSDFAIVDFEAYDDSSMAHAILQFASIHGLGGPFRPPLYLNGGYISGDGLNRITQKKAAASDHPAFSRGTDLEFHVDGTLQGPGEIKTSILGCVSNSAIGGDLVIFHASAAFDDFRETAGNVADALLDPAALRRHATVGGSTEFSDGPVFMAGDTGTFNRYCITPRDEWRFDVVSGLEQAREQFDSFFKTRTEKYQSTLKLKPGEALILNNHSVSHARTSFVDDPSTPRLMIRGLFEGPLGAPTDDEG